MHVSAFSIIFMAVSGIVSIGVPVVLFLFFHKKYSARFLPVIVGAAAFIIFALVLEQSIHFIVFRKFALKENPPVYIIYGIFMAGVFEETARFISFNLLKKKYSGIGTGLAYGVGHGGAESALLAGLVMIGNIVFSVIINTGNTAILTGKLQGDALAKMNGVINTLATTAPYLFLVSGLERMFALIIQISLSILVFYSVYGKNKVWLFPLAILLHAIIDFPAAAGQTGVLKNVFLIEGIVFVCAVAVAVAAITIHKKFKETL